MDFGGIAGHAENTRCVSSSYPDDDASLGLVRLGTWSRRSKKNIGRLKNTAGAPPWGTRKLFYLAWDYFKRRLVPRDLQMAIALLRQLEEKSPELARFNIAKMKYLVGDDSIKDDIQADCDAGFGPALYLVAANSYKKRGQIGSGEAMRYFRAAAHSGHLYPRFGYGDFRNLASGVALRQRYRCTGPGFDSL